MLSIANLKLRRPNKKLLDKFIGPFAVFNTVRSQAYKLRLPPTYRIYNVFHISLLNPFQKRAGQAKEAPPIELDNEGGALGSGEDPSH
jgi:hypothetical protein